MTREKVARIVPGGVYRFHSLRPVRVQGMLAFVDTSGDLYRVECFGFDGRTRQELVFYSGLGGADDGRMFATSPAEFAMRFRAESATAPEEEAPDAAPAEPPPEKVAGAHATGSGA